jgi:hypothetical protein
VIAINDISVTMATPTSGAEVVASVVVVIRVVFVHQFTTTIAMIEIIISAITANGLMVVRFKKYSVVSLKVIATVITASCVIFTAVVTPVHIVSATVDDIKDIASTISFAAFTPVEIAVGAVSAIDFAIFVVIVVVIAFVYEFFTFITLSETVFCTIFAPYFVFIHDNIYAIDLLKTIDVANEVVVFFFGYLCDEATTACTVNSLFVGIFIHFCFLLIVLVGC